MLNASRKKYFNTFDLLDDWWELRRIFSDIFGPILLLNNTFDMSIMVVSVYSSYLMWIQGGPMSPSLILLVVMTYTWWSMSKLILLTNALDPFGEQVGCFIYMQRLDTRVSSPLWSTAHINSMYVFHVNYESWSGRSR